jgi:ribose transport system ATP-binding protein
MDRGAATALLAMRGIAKSFGGVQALRGVDFDLAPGEVHALLGENGAGKSTLMNILSGVIAPDQGSITLDGEPHRFASPREAQAAGIITIYQELDLVPELDLAANLFLGHERLRAGFALDNRGMRAAARERLHAAGLDIDPAQQVRALGVGQRQMVAIAKALAQKARVLVMDEPTAALSAAEAKHLFELVRSLRSRGVAVVYISHRLEEVPLVADRLTVLRDGFVVGQAQPSAPQTELMRLLLGRDLASLFPPRATQPGPVLLQLVDVGYAPSAPRAGWQAPCGISLSVRAGEIVGLAGIMGAGRTELLTCLYGAGPSGRWTGQVEMAGRPVRLGSVAAARRAGLALVTDDRRGSGLMLRQSVARNVVLAILRRLSPLGLMSPAAERRAVQDALEKFDIRPRRSDLPVGSLSGGNQQKVVFARELLHGPRLLLLDEPTRGVDVGAKAEIYGRLRELTQVGLGVLVASSELPELLGLCDRIVVLRHGRSVAEFLANPPEADVLDAAMLDERQAA